MTVITIEEITGRSTQGFTRPFICRADDHEAYFVKGHHAGARSLVCEWLAGHLAQGFGLPIAPFTVLYVPEELLKLGHASGEPVADLGEGPVFGSRKCSVSELTMTSRELVPQPYRADVAVFDFWVHNADRTLSAKGGNPNLFWNAGEQSLCVIDHNLAFDREFDATQFLATHVFADALRNVASDFVERQRYALRFSAALRCWAAATASLPVAWRFADAERTIPVDFDFSGVHGSLQRVLTDNFWNLDS